MGQPDDTDQRKGFCKHCYFLGNCHKNSKGLLELPVSVSRMMEDCAKLHFTILQINGSHLDKMKELPFIHKDPFDRIIICQAQVEGMSVVTVDSFVSQYDVKTVKYTKA